MMVVVAWACAGRRPRRGRAALWTMVVAGAAAFCGPRRGARGARRRFAQWPPVEAAPQPMNPFGDPSYWERMYEGRGDLAGEAYSWFCGFRDLEPFLRELAPAGGRVLVPGCGNDPSNVDLYDAGGYEALSLFDYSPEGVKRAEALFGDRPVDVRVADCRALPYADAAFDVVLDKGTLDVLYLTSRDDLARAATELARVAGPKAVVVSLSRVCPPELLLAAFPDDAWATLRDGSLAFSQDGHATTNLAADLYAWKRRERNDERATAAPHDGGGPRST